MVVEEVDLLRNGSCWNDWQDVGNKQVNFLSAFCLPNTQTDTLAILGISPSAIDQWGMEPVDIVVLAQQSEAYDWLSNYPFRRWHLCCRRLWSIIWVHRIWGCNPWRQRCLFQWRWRLWPTEYKIKSYLFLFSQFCSELSRVEFICLHVIESNTKNY